jgi:hypothetical protein
LVRCASPLALTRTTNRAPFPTATGSPVSLQFHAQIAKNGDSVSAELWVDKTAEHYTLTSRKNVGSADKTAKQIDNAVKSGDCATLYDSAYSEWQAHFARASFIADCPTTLGAYGQIVDTSLSSAGLTYSTQTFRPVATGELVLTVGSGASAKQLTAPITLIWEAGAWRLKELSPAK